jgi:hypothetical protein
MRGDASLLLPGCHRYLVRKATGRGFDSSNTRRRHLSLPILHRSFHSICSSPRHAFKSVFEYTWAALPWWSLYRSCARLFKWISLATSLRWYSCCCCSLQRQSRSVIWWFAVLCLYLRWAGILRSASFSFAYCSENCESATVFKPSSQLLSVPFLGLFFNLPRGVVNRKTI